MILNLFRRRGAADSLIDRLHGEIVAAVRQPSLYLDYGVADTFEGRFEMLVVFASSLVRRLESLPGRGPQLAQELVDSVFRHLDIAMREMGVSDIAVPKRMKRLAGDYAGRARAYGEAILANDPHHLADALSRNVFGGRFAPDSPEVDRLARYMRAVEAAMSTVTLESLGAVPLPFPAALDTPPQGETA